MSLFLGLAARFLGLAARPLELAARLVGIAVLWPAAASALVFASPDTEPKTDVPDDFPYWEHVTQRRYQGPSVVYLGGGWALTARHVGLGEIFLEGEIFEPLRGSRRTLLNVDGRPADAMVFALEREKPLPDLPLVPIAKEPVAPGDQVVLIGFGRGRGKVIQWEVEGEPQFGFQWDAVGAKRWGTNRIVATGQTMLQGSWATRSLRLDFDEPLSAHTTLFEAQAATGDSGGAVFVRRNQTWELVGMMISVSGAAGRPDATAIYGDQTFAADLSFYRPEILRWTRPACANEEDDDGDGVVDFPADPGCDSLEDNDERGDDQSPAVLASAAGLVAALMVLVIAAWRWRRAQRGTSNPSSTRPSSAT